MSPPCIHYNKGSGPFAGKPCVVVDGHLGGSCARCHYNSSGTRYSFHAVDLTAVDEGDCGESGGRAKRMASEPLGGKPSAPALCRKGKNALKKGKFPLPSPPLIDRSILTTDEEPVPASPASSRATTRTTRTTTRGRSAFSPSPNTPPNHRSCSPTMSGALPAPATLPAHSRLALPAAPTRAAAPMEPELARQLVLVRALPAAARPAHRQRLEWALLAHDIMEGEEMEE
ncbi:hypothetical protein VE00_09789 [Pseudogymnoascus sp. WSF 3629]|nr:hypothetical protein VE00_09789 [Pseudogymnoascus sp. WSF 3629]